VIQHKNLIGEILFVYNEQFYRLTRRIGLLEFADLIGWSNRQLSAFRSKNKQFPLPVDHLAVTPLWTVGQAEDFKRILENRSIRGIRGDWTSTQEKEHWHKIELVPLEDRDDEIDENTVYEWREMAWFQEIHFFNMPDPSAPCFPAGKVLSIPETRKKLWELARNCNYRAIQFYYGNYERKVTSSLIQGPEDFFRIDIYPIVYEEVSASLYTCFNGPILVLHLEKYPKLWFIAGLNSENDAEEWLGSLGITLSDELSGIS
jgi:hypothetical protein